MCECALANGGRGERLHQAVCGTLKLSNVLLCKYQCITRRGVGACSIRHTPVGVGSSTSRENKRRILVTSSAQRHEPIRIAVLCSVSARCRTATFGERINHLTSYNTLTVSPCVCADKLNMELRDSYECSHDSSMNECRTHLPAANADRFQKKNA